MTRLCAAIFVTDLAQAQRDTATAAEAGADMVELRIDEFTGHDQVRALVSGCRLPCIVTCRPTWEGGHCELPENERMAVLEVAAYARPAYIDVELKAFRQFAVLGEVNANVPRDHRPGMIVSAHDFAGRPVKLNNVLADMAQSSADVNKIVWTARTIRDNVEAFEILQSAATTKPTIALCMGEPGLISRVLAKKFGAFLTFASLRKMEVTAPGQVTIDEMKRLYRWDALGRNTKVYGVVGSPVGHSMSPAIHNAAFDRTDYDGIYLPLLVNEGYESFKAFMESFLAFAPLDLSGLSVTIPHKENALRYLRERGAEIDPLAISIGAVNTIVIERMHGEREPSDFVAGRAPNSERAPILKLRGLNTDYGAILDSITTHLGITREGLAGKRVAVIGAGGTGRTAVAALAHYGATVVVYNRTRDRADALAAEFNGKTGKVVAAPLEKLCDSCCEIYLNTTSIGMHPNVEASPLGEKPPKLGPETLVFDTVYNPIRTKLLQQAEAAGAPTIGGIEMFVRQAVAQFETWTHRPAPVELMRSVVEACLAGK